MTPTATPAFDPKLEILPAAQRALWAELGGVPRAFTLYGGTALALHLGHRQSVDFDFFGRFEFAPSELLRHMPFLADARPLRQERNTVDLVVERAGSPVKMSFFGVPALTRLRPSLVCAENSLRVASLLDIAGTKVKTVQERAEAKDYIDIAAVILDGQVSLPIALAAGLAIYGRMFNPQITLKALTYFSDGNLAEVPEQARQTLLRAVAETDPARLPKVRSTVPPPRPAQTQGEGMDR